MQLANAIFSELGIDNVLEEEEKLYTYKNLFIISDDFYISVISFIVPENSFNLEPGDTKEQMSQNLIKLVEFLGGIVEINLAHIDTKAIIYRKDSVSAKHLLELVFELILVLKKEQMNQEGEEEEEYDDKGDQGEEVDTERNQLESMDQDQMSKSVKNDEISEDYLKNEDSKDGVNTNSQIEYQNESQKMNDTPENRNERLNDNSTQNNKSNRQSKINTPNNNNTQSNMSNRNSNNFYNNNSSNNKSAAENESVEYAFVGQKSCPDLIFVDENTDQSDSSLNKLNLKLYLNN